MFERSAILRFNALFWCRKEPSCERKCSLWMQKIDFSCEFFYHKMGWKFVIRERKPVSRQNAYLKWYWLSTICAICNSYLMISLRSRGRAVAVFFMTYNAHRGLGSEIKRTFVYIYSIIIQYKKFFYIYLLPFLPSFPLLHNTPASATATDRDRIDGHREGLFQWNVQPIANDICSASKPLPLV